MRQGATYHLLGTVAKALHQLQSWSYQPQHKTGESHQRITRLGRKWCNSVAHWMPSAGYCSKPKEHPSLWGQTVVVHDARTPQWAYNRSLWTQGMTAPLSWSLAQAILWLLWLWSDPLQSTHAQLQVQGIRFVCTQICICHVSRRACVCEVTPGPDAQCNSAPPWF